MNRPRRRRPRRLAQRDKKINLNYPAAGLERPQRAGPAEVDQRHLSALKSILPPKAVDTPEELAQLSQFVINIIDFRDPDCTMTHWVNPDVVLAGVLVPTAGDRRRTVTVADGRTDARTLERHPANDGSGDHHDHASSTSTAWSITRCDQRGAGLFVHLLLSGRPR